jgi:hypothetical protein
MQSIDHLETGSLDGEILAAFKLSCLHSSLDRTSATSPRGAQNPIVSHRLSRSTSVGPALTSRPAAIRSSPDHASGEPPTRDGPGALRPHVVAAVRQLAQLSEERVKLGTLGAQQSLSVEH